MVSCERRYKKRKDCHERRLTKRQKPSVMNTSLAIKDRILPNSTLENQLKGKERKERECSRSEGDSIRSRIQNPDKSFPRAPRDEEKTELHWKKKVA
jgi:hypothetical protein